MTQEPNAGGAESPAEIEQEIARTRARLGTTLDAIEDRLSPEHLMEQGMAYLREEAGEWGAEIGDFVRRNPIPIAILGLGLGWIAYSAMRPRDVGWNDDEYGAGPEGLYGPAHAGYVDPYSPDRGSEQEFRVTRSPGAAGMRGGSESADGSGVMDRMSDMGSRLGSRAQEMRDTIAEQASSYADQASSRLGDLWHRASELADSAREVADHARERLASIAGDTREGVGRIQTEVVRTAEERPLLLGAIGLGAGLLIGLCLPSTRAEARTLGRRRDEFFDSVRQAGSERLTDAMDTVQRVAETALDTAKEEAADAFQLDKGKTKAEGQASDRKEAGQTDSGQSAGQGQAKTGGGATSGAGTGASAGSGSSGAGTGASATSGSSGASGASASGTGSSGAATGATGTPSSTQSQGADTTNKGASSATPKP